MNKPTKGPWGFRYRFNPGDREHDQIDAYAITANNGETTIAETLFSCKDDEANAQLLAAAVNACFALNPDNPLAVAEALPELVEAGRNALAWLRDPNGWEKAHNPKGEFLPNMLEDALTKIGVQP